MSNQSCPLAIVGMSCLFPKADDLQAYWANIKNGVDAITPIPLGSHWNAADYFDADPKSPDRTYAQRGGFLSPVSFNPMEFGMAPKDIEATDTTQLLSMVAAQRALADAGYASGSAPGRAFERDRTSVILGVTGALELVIPLGARLGHPHWRKALKDAGVEAEVAEDVVQRISESYVGWQENSFPGLLGNVAAGRIANRLDLGGTNCVVDAACASSLAAIHLAALELSAGLSDMVITGGIDTFNDIFMYMCFSKTPALSPTGDAKPFDKDSDGTVLGEGLGVLVLKRLADAERDGDRIYAVIKGIGSSSDGRSSAIYAPRAGGQKLALQRAYAAAGVTPESIELVEGHGTGTKVGDATELAGLSEVFRESGNTGTWCALGSVKSQIGHTKAAAGVAGVIKTAMALHRKVLPPTIKVRQPLEGAAPGHSPFYVNTRKRPWLPSPSHPRRAGVSALGFGGTNFHCVLEEHQSVSPGIDWDGDTEILALCSDDLKDLQAQVARLDGNAKWLNFRRHAAGSRREFRPDAGYRLLMAVTAQSDRTSLRETALGMLEKNPGKRTWSAPAGIAFGAGPTAGRLAALFPGQGSQYVGMLRDLVCQFPQMLEELALADGIFTNQRDNRTPPRLSDLIYPHPAFSDDVRASQEAALKSTDVAQPALGAMSLGVLRVLQHFEVAIAAACGHSYGELSALCCAGRIAPEALHRLSNLRGQLMAQGSTDRGSMLAVQADEESVEAFLREENNGLIIANRNSPKQVVLAGPTEAICQAEAALERRSIRSRILQVSAAFHSPLVADAREPFAKALEHVDFPEGALPVYANSTGGKYPSAPEEARDLLAQQIVRPVNFTQQIRAMHADGVRCFVEVGPGRVLGDLVQAIFPEGDVDTIAVDASRGARPGSFDLAFALSRLAALGHPVSLEKWENAPPAAVAATGKPAFSVEITGANYRAPQPHRAPATPKPAQAATLPPPAQRVVATPDRNPSQTPAIPNMSANPMPPSGSLPKLSSTPDRISSADIPAALQAAQEGILALQRLQEQTAQLHKQFLEGQESARRAIETLLSLGAGGTAPAESVTFRPTTAPLYNTPATVASAAAPTAVPASTPVPQVAARVAAEPAKPVVEPAISGSRSDPANDLANDFTADRAVFEQAVLEVVADKTGYPMEMLNLGMGMDADLGIDSIKRVEIMAALRSRLPEAPEIRPEHLGSLQTLEQVVAFLANGAQKNAAPARRQAQPAAEATAAAITPAPAATPVATDASAQVAQTLLEVVADKTGYPVEMLNLEMGMDADLGIDSIKRVEIMAALRARLPDSPEIRPEHLGSLQTLQQIVDFLGAGAPPESAKIPTRTDSVAKPAPAEAASTTVDAEQIAQVLLAVVAEKTGYPVEMLNLDMGLDADLGIDSIKRVEIMASLRTQLPESREIKPEHLGSLQSLRQIVEFLQGAPSEASAPSTTPAKSAAAAAGTTSATETRSAIVSAPATSETTAGQDVQRQVVRVVELAASDQRDVLSLARGSTVWLLDDASELGRLVEEALVARGLKVRKGDQPEKFAAKGVTAPGALLVMSPAAGSDQAFLQRAFRLLQLAGPGLRKGGKAGTAIFATLSRLDGAFGFGQTESIADPVSGGLAGLVKTAQREWTEVQCKAMDLNPAMLASPETAATIVDEMFRSGPVEVGLSGTTRVALDIAVQPLTTASGRTLPLDSGDVLVVSGGARGVTADAALAMARASRCTLILLGRSPLPPEEPEWARGLTAEAEIKKALFARQAGGTPSAVEAAYRQLMAQREIRAQLARLEAVGARAEYSCVDVRDRAALERVLTDVRRRHGAIRGLVHGAGVLADRRIEDKTLDQFDSVYGTKVEGLQNLLQATAKDALKVIALFSSYTGRFGRIGQVDYAAANEVLNKIAQQQSRRRPDCRVVSVNWGPWNGGMVTPGLRKVFEQEGVGLIEPLAGAGFLVDELRFGAQGDVEVLALGPTPHRLDPPKRRVLTPAFHNVAFEREVSVKALPCLESHVFNGRAVLPAALMVEWLAQAALHCNPGMRFHGLDDFKVLKGVVLDAGQSVNVTLVTGEPRQRDKLLVLPVRMVSHADGRDVLHAQTDVLLTEEKLPAAPAAKIVDISGGSIADAYSLGVLFHGAALQGIEKVEVCAERGVAAVIKAASAPIKWMSNPLRGTWIADPLALDSAFQMMILWSAAHRGGPSLPSALGHYRQFVGAFPKGGCRAVIAVALGISAIATATIQFLDRQGNLLASAEGCEFVVDANLRDAFRLNRLKLEK